MLAISMDTVIMWLLGALIFLIYIFTSRKKLVSVLIWFRFLYKDTKIKLALKKKKLSLPKPQL